MGGWAWACDYCHHSGATWEGGGGHVTTVTTQGLHGRVGVGV